MPSVRKLVHNNNKINSFILDLYHDDVLLKIETTSVLSRSERRDYDALLYLCIIRFINTIIFHSCINMLHIYKKRTR